VRNDTQAGKEGISDRQACSFYSKYEGKPLEVPNWGGKWFYFSFKKIAMVDL
jgi:hypothetical protein